MSMTGQIVNFSAYMIGMPSKSVGSGNAIQGPPNQPPWTMALPSPQKSRPFTSPHLV